MTPAVSTSNANGPDETFANAAIVPFGATGAAGIAGISVFTQGGTHLVVDVSGYFLR